jgi:imidazolonepropionase-like amidohydrolase
MNPILITADRLWDGTGSPSLLRPVVRVAGENIDSVEQGLLQTATCTGERVDFAGCTILPGMIDTHVHLVMSALDTNEAIIAQVQGENDEQLLARVQANAQAALRTGLTTLRDCGGTKNLVQQMRDRIRRGEVADHDADRTLSLVGPDRGFV